MRPYRQLSDQELLPLFRQGDEAAYLEIYHRYKTLLQHHAYKKLGDLDEVEDLLQELFTDLWQKREQLQPGGNLSGYLYVAVRNRILNNFHRKERETNYLESLADFVEKGECITDREIRERELFRLVEEEIAELSPRVREVFVLSRKKGLSHKEIARQLGTSEQTVSKQVSLAIRSLRGRLDRLLGFFL